MRRIHFPTVGSTNDEARRLTRHHPEAPFVVTAEMQTAGRGRRGRSWVSPVGGAWMSVAWPMHRPPDFYTPAPLVAALAVDRAITAALPHSTPDLRLKWPNDLLLDGRKVAGILCEGVLPARLTPPEISPGPSSSISPSPFLIIGVGINADFEADELPHDDLRFPATTLRSALARSVPVEPLIEVFQKEIHALLTHFDAEGLTSDLLARIRDLLAFDGEMIELAHESGQIIRGRQRGLDDAGRLQIESRDGVIVCLAGEITRCRPVTP